MLRLTLVSSFVMQSRSAERWAESWKVQCAGFDDGRKFIDSNTQRKIGMNDPTLLKLKDDLRSLMSAELQLIDMIIHLLQDRGATKDEEAEEIIRTTLLMYQGLGVSIHSILKLTEVPDMGIRDCFSIARGVVETSINIAYIVSSKSEIAQKAQAHALQRFYRDLSKAGIIAGTRISVSSNAIPSIESIPGLEQALKQFTDKNGREIRD